MLASRIPERVNHSSSPPDALMSGVKTLKLSPSLAWGGYDLMLRTGALGRRINRPGSASVAAFFVVSATGVH